MPATLELQKGGVAYTWEMGDEEAELRRMCNGDVALELVKYEPAAVRSNRFETTLKRLRMYCDVESTCVRNVQLGNVGNTVKLAEGESSRILLAVPRETWFYRHMASKPWDPLRATGSAGCQ